MRWVDNRDGLLSFVPPRAGGKAFLRYRLAINSSELAARLREEISLLVLPGDVYGMDHHIRLGIGDQESHFNAGLALLGEALEELAQAESS